MTINSVCGPIIILMVLICSCGRKESSNIHKFTNTAVQSTIFRYLVTLTQGAISEDIQEDSLAFLILPVQASCPSCRDKTIDSIVKHSKDLADRHFVIISAKGGRKTINGYFRENDKELPFIQNKLFIDSTNQAYKYRLHEGKPTIYYTFKGKALKKVGAIPSTIREDLRGFFSGYRNEKK